MYQDLKVFQESYNFFIWLNGAIDKFPKTKKSVLGKRLEDLNISLEPKTKFEIIAKMFSTSFKRKINLNNKDVGKDVGKRLDFILSKIKTREYFTYFSLAKELNVTDKTIERDLKKLVVNNKIKHIGSKRKGSWKIIKE